MRNLRLIVCALLALAAVPWAANAAVVRCEGHYAYVGLAADTKPTSPQTCDTFRETDTEKEYIWDGGAWVSYNRPITQGTLTKGEDTSLNRLMVYEVGDPKNLTSSGQVKGSAGVVYGFFVSASTSCTVKLWDNTAGSGTVLLPTTAALTAPGWYPAKFRAGTGIYATLGGTCDVTFSYQ